MRDLSGVHPSLIAAVAKILDGMAAIGFPMMVTDTVRSVTDQEKLYAQGRTEPGSIVTQSDGVLKKSAHQLKADGWGHAVDMTFVVNGKPSWDESHPWNLYGAAAEACGCKWGGRWTTPDRPHIEWPS